MKPITFLYDVSIIALDGSNRYSSWTMGVEFYAIKSLILRKKKQWDCKTSFVITRHIVENPYALVGW